MINLRIDNLTRPDRFIIFYMRIIDFLLIKNWKFLLWSLYSHSSLINRTFKFLIIPLQLSIFFISFVMFLFIYHPLSWEMLFFLLLKIAPKILCFSLSHHSNQKPFQCFFSPLSSRKNPPQNPNSLYTHLFYSKPFKSSPLALIPQLPFKGLKICHHSILISSKSIIKPSSSHSTSFW